MLTDGLLLYEILHGRTAFSGTPPMLAMMQAMAGARPHIDVRPEHAPLAPLMAACWHADVAQRPSMEEVVQGLTA